MRAEKWAGASGKVLPAVAIFCAAVGAAQSFLHAFAFRGAVGADEAIIGLMARHIATDGSWPAFYYGQAYLGALEAYIMAALGATPLALKIVPACFLTALIGVTFAWTRTAFGRDAACLASLLVALPPVYVFDFGLRAGGFIQAIVMLLAVMLLAHRASRDGSDRIVGLLGLVCGLTVWTYQTFVIHLLVLAAIYWRKGGLPGRRMALIGTAGFLIGCAPLLAYNAIHPLATVRDLSVKYVGVTGTLYKAHGAMGAVFHGAIRRAWDVASIPRQLAILYTSDPDVEEPDASPFAIAAILVLTAAVAAGARVGRTDRDRPSLTVVALGMLMATLVTGFFRPRYLMPVVVFAATLAGRGLTRARPLLMASVMALVVGYNVQGIWADFRADDPAPYDGLISTLKRRGLRYGYTGYEIAYPVAFLSGETIILSPKAGPVTFDRLPRYTEQVRTQARVCYIFEDGSEIDARFRALLAQRGASCERILAGRFAVYDGLPPEVAHAIPLPVGVVTER